MKPNITQLKKPDQGILYLIPWIFGVICFQIGPIVVSLILSFTDYSLFGSPAFYGLNNFREMFQDELFVKATKVTFSYVAISVPPKVIFALIVALIMNQKIKIREHL